MEPKSPQSPRSPASPRDSEKPGVSGGRLTDDEIKIFNAICMFVDDIHTYLAGTKHANPAVARYNELLKHMRLVHKKHIRQHIGAFKAFVDANAAQIAERRLDVLKVPIIQYSERVFINIPEILKKCDDASREVVVNHLLNLQYHFNPTEEIKHTLMDIMKGVNAAAPVAGAPPLNLGGGDLEGLGGIFSAISRNIDPNEPNPMNSIMKLIGSPAFGEIVSEVQKVAQNGGLNNILGALAGGSGAARQLPPGPPALRE